MIALAPEDVRLGARAATKDEAIRAVGRLLVERGYIEAPYIESMLGRELQANTYLGNGIAIPHGMGKDRELILRTGVAVLQLPHGVTWSDGQNVQLVVGIAAKSDEHIGILAALTDVLDDAGQSERLARTNDAAEIVAALTRDASPEQAAEALPGAQHVDVEIAGAAGLHARPATAFIEVASRFASEIRVQYGTRVANGKALASLLKLGVEGGATIRILAAGDDAAAALAALREAVEQGLGDEAEHETSAEPAPTWMARKDLHVIHGVSASPGLAIGPLFRVQAARIVVSDRPGVDPEAESRALDGAIESAREQLDALYASVKERAGKNEASIFRAHQAMLTDDDLLREVRARIAGNESAAWAWQQSIQSRVTELANVANERLAARSVDLHDVGQRVLRLLAGTEYENESVVPAEPVILVADDLTPSDTAKLDPKRILALCTASGGPTSHTAIIARSLDLPAVVGAGASVLEQRDGTMAILDGTAGRLYVDPTADDIAAARAFQVDLHSQRDREFDTRYQPAILTDGHRVEIAANIAKPAEAAQAVDAGAEGVGLLRTEFLFLGRDRAPTEDEQFAAYSEMTGALQGLPLIIRTLDIGGDKVVPYLAMPKEENPFLGVRGVRLCLRRPELFLPQLRAIYRAAATGPVRIMFPMIATLEDLQQAKEVAERVRQELSAPRVDIGIMIEVPSAAIMAPELAAEVDFFSIGTNDLTQYVLAIDRMHPVLAGQADALHPAVLRMIDMTVRAADAAGKWVGVCGGVAGDPAGALILTGLGVTELSMSIPSIAAVKATMRRYSLRQAKAFAKKALACKSAPEVRALALP